MERPRRHRAYDYIRERGVIMSENNTEQTPKEPRTAEYLVNHGIPHTEMTVAEYESVVEWRAKIIARDTEYTERMAEATAMRAAMAKRMARAADACNIRMGDEVAAANARLEKALEFSEQVRGGNFGKA